MSDADLRVKHEAFFSAAPTPIPLNIDALTTMAEPGTVPEGDFL